MDLDLGAVDHPGLVSPYPTRARHHGVPCPRRTRPPRRRAVWHEVGRREQCEAATEEKLAAKLEMVRARLAADAPNMLKPGADLIAHYLDPTCSMARR